MPSTPVIVQRTLIITMRPCDLGSVQIHRPGVRRQARCSSSKFQVTPYSPRRNSLGHTSKEKHSNFRLTQCSFGLKMSFHSKFIQSSFKVHSKFIQSSFLPLPAIEIWVALLSSPNLPRLQSAISRWLEVQRDKGLLLP